MCVGWSSVAVGACEVTIIRAQLERVCFGLTAAANIASGRNGQSILTF